MMEANNIKAFVQITGQLFTSGQPNEDQLASLAKEGLEVVVNLGLMDPRYCLENEEKTVRLLGLSYVHIPVDFQSPTQEDLMKLFDALDLHWGKKILVHCAANYRVSVFVSLYLFGRLGWQRERAESMIHQVWQPNDVWQSFFNESCIALERAKVEA